MSRPSHNRASGRRSIARREFLRGSAGAATLLVAGGGLLSEGLALAGRSTVRRLPDLQWPAPPIVTRAQWGANEALRLSAPEYDTVVEKLVIHHTVTPNAPRDPHAVVRSVFAWDLARGWNDMGYNFLIDEAGRIYEGRWAANYPSGVAHTGEDVHHRQVRGAHALGHNDRTIGIALLGTYTTRTPPPAMVNGLVDLLTWKCARWAIDPLGTSTYVDGDNHRQNVPNIIGHRDICPTICPGQGAHDLLPAVRSQVSARLDAGDQAYWVVSSSGRVVPGGAAQAQRLPAAPQYGAVATTRPHGRAGLWVLTPRGQVLALAGAVHHGDLVTHPRAHAPVRALVSSASGNGYWIVGTDGSVFGFGDAVPHGSLAGHKMSTPIVGAAAQPSGLGYWLLGQDGGVFCFGRAGYHGSAFPHGMSDRAVSIVETADGLGYWIVHRSGAVRSFGSAARVAWVRGPSAPLVEVRRNASGLIGLCADGNFVHTVGAAAYPSLQRALGGAVPVGFVMGG